VRKKSTFLIPSGPLENPDKKHLHIILTDSDENGDVLAVSVSTYKNKYCDGTCILNAGDHPFIKHKSWVVYRNIGTFPVSDIQEGVHNGTMIRCEDLADEVFQRVIKGCLIKKSDAETSSRVRKLLKKYFG